MVIFDGFGQFYFKTKLFAFLCFFLFSAENLFVLSGERCDC